MQCVAHRAKSVSFLTFMVKFMVNELPRGHLHFTGTMILAIRDFSDTWFSIGAAGNVTMLVSCGWRLVVQAHLLVLQEWFWRIFLSSVGETKERLGNGWGDMRSLVIFTRTWTAHHATVEGSGWWRILTSYSKDGYCFKCCDAVN